MNADRDASTAAEEGLLREEAVDEWGEQSFPASDPPPTWTASPAWPHEPPGHDATGAAGSSAATRRGTNATSSG